MLVEDKADPQKYNHGLELTPKALLNANSHEHVLASQLEVLWAKIQQGHFQGIGL